MDKDFLLHRKTIRHYSDAGVSETLLNSLIEKAVQAPTLGGMQLYSVVVTRDTEMKKCLAPCHFNQPMVTQAPVVLTFCADFHRFEQWCLASGAEPGYGNFQSFIGAMLDATILAQQFVTAAEMEGLGCCYLGTTTYNAPEIARVLCLPDKVVPVITVTLGYPLDAAAEPKAERLPTGAIVHSEKYADFTATDIKKIYAEKESLEVNKKYVAENSKPSLAHVFTDIRYNRANNDHFSRVLRDFLQAQGYPFPTD